MTIDNLENMFYHWNCERRGSFSGFRWVGNHADRTDSSHWPWRCAHPRARFGVGALHLHRPVVPCPLAGHRRSGNRHLSGF
jgi:hypothetical protein